MLVIRTRQQRPQNQADGANQDEQAGGNVTQEETQIAIITPRNNIRGRNRNNNNNNNNASFWRNPQFYATVWFFVEQFLLYIATMSNPIFHIIEEILFRMAGMNIMNMFANPRIHINIGHMNIMQAQMNSIVLDENIENQAIDQQLDEEDSEFNASQIQSNEFNSHSDWTDPDELLRERTNENVPLPVPVLNDETESVTTEQTTHTETLDNNDIGIDFDVQSNKDGAFDSIDAYSVERISSAIKNLEAITNDINAIDIPSRSGTSDLQLLENPNRDVKEVSRSEVACATSSSLPADGFAEGTSSPRVAYRKEGTTEISESQKVDETSVYERHKNDTEKTSTNRDRV